MIQNKRCNDIDWNEHWIHQMMKHNIANKNIDCSMMWSSKKKADQYLQRSLESNWGKCIMEKIRYFNFDSISSILDIGAGPGTLAIPLSKQVDHITAVEPAYGMVRCLKEYIHKNNIDNVSIIGKKWEDIDIVRDFNQQYDLVIASFSLGMIDIRQALKKMDTVSSKYVCLFWHGGVPLWEGLYSPIWQSLHGMPYEPVPKADCVIKVLAQMGIQPTSCVDSMKSIYQFTEKDHIFDFFKHRFQVSSKCQEDILKRYLEKIFSYENNCYVLKGSSEYAMIWWEKKK